MRPIYVATVLVLLGMTGLTHAGAAGDQALTIDLSVVPGGSTYFLKCSRSNTLANCGLVSLWEQTNGHPELQAGVFVYGGRPIDPDLKLLA